MIKPFFPPDEATRLASLRKLNILDTPAEERFDRITRLAKQFFGVSIALISLIDTDRQWFKSRQGLTACETSRDISFCGHTILGDEALVVEDARQDVRFQDNLLVTGEPHIRFYAGYPILAPDGNKIGTLCIIDQASRKMSAGDLRALQDFAGLVE